MPRKHTKHKTHRRRGRGIMDWAKRAHQTMRKHKGYSTGLSYAYNKFGKNAVAQRLSKSNAALVNSGIKAGLSKLRQSGYGLSRAGNGLRRSGMGSRLKY
jgi:hypothetical protein